MSKKRKPAKGGQSASGGKKESRFSLNRKTQRLIVAIILFTLAIILFLGLVNLAGVAGEFLVLGLETFFGWASWLVPVVLVLAGWLILKYEDIKEMNQASDRRYPSLGTRCSGLLLLVIILSAIFHIYFVDDKIALIEHYGGGYFGYGLSYIIVKTFGFWASWVIFIGLFVIGLIIVLSGLVSFKKEQEEDKEDKEEEVIQQSLFKKTLGGLKSIFKRKQKLVLKPESTDKLLAESTEEEYEEEYEEEIIPKIKNIFTKTKGKKDEMSVSYTKSHQKIDLPLSLLGADSTKPNAGDTKENKLIIKKTLENFNISVEMGEIKIGPTVTQYTLKPADGVKLSQITSLHNDLALALAAHPIRIEAPIPGQSLVGIEIPNQQVAIIRLRSILSDNAFKNRKSNLTVALGRDVAGNIWLADVGKMPHCLVAGSTGSGKTIFLNSVIISLIYQNSPDDLRFILVDPKRVELTFYNDLPHLLTPVITNVQKTINALKWAVGEMDRRFDVMAEAKKRDINTYNQANPENKLPFIVIIIDELADLMVTATQEVEACIVRLAQMARATGIHLIMATQRPSVDIITGLIKANITSRVAFSVASLMDSRTILDFSGAEKLLGRGDMLFVSSELSKPKRIQGAFVSDDEVKGIVEYLRNITEPNFQEDITESHKIEIGSEHGDLKEDEMLPEARDVVIHTGKASASFLQRRLRIGYARAARLLDLLENEETIGPADGAKPREVYKSSSDEEDL
ncbi:DNA translocase FtsK [Patescibacteria group bacterium]|nr:DNA translocase FtsK [Patescibacteria group bacterium]